MGMGYCAEHSVIIPNDKLGEVIGKSAADNLMDMLSKVDGIYVNDTYVNHVFDPDTLILLDFDVCYRIISLLD